jgi:IS30 family transposase
MKSTYQQLTYEQRCQIYTLKKTGFSQRAIAAKVGVAQQRRARERIYMDTYFKT